MASTDVVHMYNSCSDATSRKVLYKGWIKAFLFWRSADGAMQDNSCSRQAVATAVLCYTIPLDHSLCGRLMGYFFYFYHVSAVVSVGVRSCSDDTLDKTLKIWLSQ